MNSALLHFVWQGAAIAFLLAVLLIFTKSARARYAWACAALLAMPVSFGITLWLSLPPEPAAALLRLPPFFPLPPGSFETFVPVPTPWTPDPAAWWMTGVSMLYAYRALGWLAARRLRKRGVCAAPTGWQKRIVELGNRIRQTRRVILLESAFAETPMTIGLWRPVILMPLGLLAGLPAEQVEAILLHELAHIRRHDYLVNLLQALIEGLLFYHPATWWVSHVIRREREMCCDDLVVSATGDTLAYTQALAAIEEHRVRVPILAATEGPLMIRIQRLLGQPSRFSIAPALIFLVLATGAVLYAFHPDPVPLPEPIPAPEPAPVPEPAPQATPSPQQAPVGRPSIIERVLADDKTTYDKWLNQEVAWIISAEERSAFKNLATDGERQQFIEQFWLRRDPTPDTPSNEFKDEYYRRLAWSNDHFTEPGSPGWTTDRGMIYIRFGPPSEREEHPADPSTYGNEKWRYPFLQGIGTEVVIGFVDEAGNGKFRMSWDDRVRAEMQRTRGRGGLTDFQLLRALEDRFARLRP